MELLTILLAMVWRCLCSPNSKQNPLFSLVFFDEDIPWEIASSAGLCFCPNLLETIQSHTPPPVTFFTTLPTDAFGSWASYAIVLMKPGSVTIVYVGEASEAIRGAPARFALYDRCNPQRPNVDLKTCPSNVKKALNSGYKIVHKGLLAWVPIPLPKDVPRIRLLMYAFEAMFCYLFWTLHSKTMDFEIRCCCPWSLQSITYAGGCSHNPLNDVVKGGFGFTDEQLKTLAAEAAENVTTSQ